MYVVAITRLSTPVEVEASALASDLGTLAYEERLKLATGCPVVVLMTPDAERARLLHGKLRARGHDTLHCVTSAIVPSSEMISLKRFRFEADALIAVDAGARLPWDDVSTLVRAHDRRRRETTTNVKERKFALGRAIATGGLISSKTTNKEVHATIDDSEQVLYLFRLSGELPWLLREQGTHYDALGAQLTASSATNFAITVEQFKARAAHAHYDDRLLTRRRPHQPTAQHAAKVSSPHDLDLLAHLISATPS